MLKIVLLSAVLLTAYAEASQQSNVPTNDMPSATTAYGVHEFNLANGLKLLVKEDHRAPVVVSQIWYRVGSADEHGGITGISHFLEHMMFKGTEKYPRQAFTETIKKYGGRDNAFTSRDYTAYYQLFEKSYLEKSFELESDRMINLQLKQEDFDKEREVVREERRWRVDDKPESRLYEQLYASAFDSAPYRHPVIGWDNDLVNLKLADLADWYSRWYAPNNATLIVVGDVVANEVYTLAQQYFADLKPQPLPDRKPREEISQHGEKRITLSVPTTQPAIAIAYKTPRVGQAEESWHAYALSVLAQILSSGDSSRFSKNLIRGKGIAFYANVYFDVYNRYQDLFVIFAAPNTTSDVAELQRAIEDELTQLKEQLVDAEELEKIKTRLLAYKVYEQDSIQHRAAALGRLETSGAGWQEHFRFPQHIQAVTAEQIKQVANKYLVASQRTVAELKPLPLHSDSSIE
ncbi:MAG: insulinase family protein [Chromatiales bacterium]|nr:insulinase family protein [Chromatiales bacterium]